MVMMDDLKQLELGMDPFENFSRWLEKAEGAGLIEPTAMTLATVDGQGRPHARIVLYKGLSAAPEGRRGFKIFTNYDSPKASDLKDNGFAALVFFWPSLGRQIRVEGAVERLPDVESDEYFASRPRGSQIGAWASPQSQRIASREELLERVRSVEEKFSGVEVPRPLNWGGWRLMPNRIEFWQAGDFRLHDRIRFESDDGKTWQVYRLAP